MSDSAQALPGPGWPRGVYIWPLFQIAFEASVVAFLSRHPVFCHVINSPIPPSSPPHPSASSLPNATLTHPPWSSSTITNTCARRRSVSRRTANAPGTGRDGARTLRRGSGQQVCFLRFRGLSLPLAPHPLFSITNLCTTVQLRGSFFFCLNSTGLS